MQPIEFREIRGFLRTLHIPCRHCGTRRGPLLEQRPSVVVFFDKKCEPDRYRTHIAESLLESSVESAGALRRWCAEHELPIRRQRPIFRSRLYNNSRICCWCAWQMNTSKVSEGLQNFSSKVPDGLQNFFIKMSRDTVVKLSRQLC